MKIHDTESYQLDITAAWHDWGQVRLEITRTIDGEPYHLELYLDSSQVEKIRDLLTSTLAQ